MATYVVMKENTSDHSSDYTAYAGGTARKAMNTVENEVADTTYTEVWVGGYHLYTVTGCSKKEHWAVYKFADENTFYYDWKGYTLERLLNELSEGKL